MTPLDVTAVVRRTPLRPTGAQLYARTVEILLALLFLVTWLASLNGCSMDRGGLNSDLTIRGRLDDDAGETDSGLGLGPESPQPDGGIGNPDVGPVVLPDANPGDTGGTVSTDGGTTLRDAAGVPDVTADVPPSECPFDPTLSLSPCNSVSALCRTYDTPGVPVYLKDCKAEGYVCVVKCPT